jgi:hypothetical protein
MKKQVGQMEREKKGWNGVENVTNDDVALQHLAK